MWLSGIYIKLTFASVPSFLDSSRPAGSIRRAVRLPVEEFLFCIDPAAFHEGLSLLQKIPHDYWRDKWFSHMFCPFTEQTIPLTLDTSALPMLYTLHLLKQCLISQPTRTRPPRAPRQTSIFQISRKTPAQANRHFEILYNPDLNIRLPRRSCLLAAVKVGPRQRPKNHRYRPTRRPKNRVDLHTRCVLTLRDPALRARVSGL